MQGEGVVYYFWGRFCCWLTLSCCLALVAEQMLRLQGSSHERQTLYRPPTPTAGLGRWNLFPATKEHLLCLITCNDIKSKQSALHPSIMLTMTISVIILFQNYSNKGVKPVKVYAELQFSVVAAKQS
jgi:hypothetical protein